jgi:endonuclease I
LKFISLILITLIFNVTLYSDPPVGYYDSAEGLSGEALKSALHEIIDDHTEFPYTSTSTDTWDILKETDQDPSNPDNVILFYTDWSVNGDQEYNSGSGWSREHVWAKSHGDFGTTIGPGTDAHNLKPCDISLNSARGNLDFDEGGTQYIDGDGATNNYSDSDSWEPWDDVKGDVARIIFYMATRYEGDNGEPDLEVVDYVNSSPDGEPLHGKLSTLYQWNLDDPVSTFEMHRNDVIYEDFQGNRNPYIDHPEYVTYIWGGEIPGDTESPVISDVIVLSPVSIVVDFNEYMEETSAETLTNYAIDNGIGNPVSAVLGYEGDLTKVLLQVIELSAGTIYTITINNVEDTNENAILPNSTFQFELSSNIVLIDQSFEAGLGNWSVFSSTSNVDWERTSITSWPHPSSVPDGDYYMHINNYGADAPGDDWLISPQLDLSLYGSPTLSFYSWNQFSDSVPGLEVKYSLDYIESSDPNGFTWSTIPADLAEDGSTIWLQENGVDLSVLDGVSSVYVAFHYTSTGTSNGTCNAWAVDEVILTAELVSEPQLPTPQNLLISYSENSITLNWDVVSEAESYNIYSSTDPTTVFGNWQYVDTVTDMTSWSTGITANRKFYKVTAE